jgi:hypothetical protein
MLNIQCLNGASDNVELEFNPSKDTISLNEGDWDPGWKAQLKIENPEPHLLKLKGIVNGVEISAQLHKIPESEFILTKSRFRFLSD